MKKNLASLTNGNITLALARMTAPMTIGILGMVIFNLIDTFFLSRLGTDPLAAISFTYPIISIISSIAQGLGMGAAALVSRKLGAGKILEVKKITLDILILTIFIVAFFALIGIITIKPLFSLLGAKKGLIPMISSYMIIWYPGILFIITPMISNNIIRATGDTKTPSLIMLTAVLINLILDPILIFGIGPIKAFGMQGAAIATISARATIMLLSFIIIIKKGLLIIEHRKFRELILSWKALMKIAIPVSAGRLIVPIGTGIILKIVANFGKSAVAGFGVASKIDFFAMTIVAALSMVIGPFVGQNLGAGRIDRISKGLNSSLKFIVLWGISCAIIFFFTGKYIAYIWTSNPKIILTISLYLSIIPWAYPFSGMIMMYSQSLIVSGKQNYSTLVSFIQIFVFHIPFTFIGSKLFGLKGLLVAMPFSFIIMGIIIKYITDRHFLQIKKKVINS